MKPVHKNIPFFIPHEGCGFSCIFCSQTKITGVCRGALDIERECAELRQTVEAARATLGENTAEIAFFGGSFTGIEPERMTALLETAAGLLGGAITGIRLSTRPDYISDGICKTLKKYGVTAVELGIQSVSERVLDLSRRGHHADVSEKACRLVKEYGFLLTGQMMCGLPGSQPSDEIETARAIVGWGCDSARIYPTVVFESTPLYDLTLSGKYTPLTTDEAVRRAADCAEIFIENGVEILRIGLHSSENLKNAPFGATHPALGELVMGELYFRRLLALLEAVPDERVTVYVPSGSISKAVGHKRINALRLEECTKKKLSFREDSRLAEYQVRTEPSALSDKE